MPGASGIDAGPPYGLAMTDKRRNSHLAWALAVAGLIVAAFLLLLAPKQPAGGAEPRRDHTNAAARASALEGGAGTGFRFAHLKVHLHHHGPAVAGRATFALGDTGRLTVGARCNRIATPRFFRVYGRDSGRGTAKIRAGCPQGVALQRSRPSSRARPATAPSARRSRASRSGDGARETPRKPRTGPSPVRARRRPTFIP